MNLGSRKGESGVLARPTLGLIASQLGDILVRVRAEQELEKDIEKRREAEEALAVNRVAWKKPMQPSESAEAPGGRQE